MIEEPLNYFICDRTFRAFIKEKEILELILFRNILDFKRSPTHLESINNGHEYILYASQKKNKRIDYKKVGKIIVKSYILIINSVISFLLMKIGFDLICLLK